MGIIKQQKQHYAKIFLHTHQWQIHPDRIRRNPVCGRVQELFKDCNRKEIVHDFDCHEENGAGTSCTFVSAYS